MPRSRMIGGLHIDGRQNANGSWDYRRPDQGDTSISQYAVLGLWGRENAGVDVSPGGLGPRRLVVPLGPERRREAGTTIATSRTTRNAVDDRRRGRQPADLPAATRSLPPGPARHQHAADPARAREPASSDYHAVDHQRADRAGGQPRDGVAGGNFHPATGRSLGQTPYYMLYGIERIGALADEQTIGRLDWYDKGREFIRSTQQADGSWNGHHGAEMNTVWAILFLTKSTAKTIQRIKIQRLGAGTLLGGRSCPRT